MRTFDERDQHQASSASLANRCSSSACREPAHPAEEPMKQDALRFVHSGWRSAGITSPRQRSGTGVRRALWYLSHRYNHSGVEVDIINLEVDAC